MQKIKISKISENNLKRDKKVLGKNWKKTYNSYFSDPTNINAFIKAVLPEIQKAKTLKNKKLNILYAGGANGLLGEKLVEALQKKGFLPALYLLDISQEHLNQNKNKKTTKILADFLSYNSEIKFDIIIMRSALDYIYRERLQIKALKNLKSQLAENGLFFNCVAAMPTNKERNLADKIYASNKLIGKRHFQSKEDINKLYSKAGIKELKLIGKSKNLIITEKEHIERYNFAAKEVNKISQIITRSKLNSKRITITSKSYKLDFIFPIYLAKK